MGGRFAVVPAISGQERLDRIRANMKRGLPMLTALPAREGSVAVCGYGPSLRETWQDVKTDYVISTSGAHDFLIERGIVPDYHVEFDPRPHKAFFLQYPHTSVTYLLSSSCNDLTFKVLEGSRICMWHGMANPDEDCALINELEDDGILVHGGSNVGLRAFFIAHVLGFRKFELFGIDCSYTSDATWAGPHSGAKHHMLTVRCNDKLFLSSDAMINAAEELYESIGQLGSSCHVTVHGEHLFAERVRLMGIDREKAASRWWEPVGFELVDAPLFEGVAETDALISEPYRELNRQLHAIDPGYGTVGSINAGQVSRFMRLLNTTDVLDYGCGKRKLEKALGRPIKNYDPCIAGLDVPPEPADICVCVDVLEHIEPASLNAVLRDLMRVTKRLLLVTISTQPAMKQLPDGRNTHLIIREASWWIKEFSHRFDFLHKPITLEQGVQMMLLPQV